MPDDYIRIYGWAYCCRLWLVELNNKIHSCGLCKHVPEIILWEDDEIQAKDIIAKAKLE